MIEGHEGCEKPDWVTFSAIIGNQYCQNSYTSVLKRWRARNWRCKYSLQFQDVFDQREL